MLRETLLLTDERCLAHDPGANHPENPKRLAAILDALAHCRPEGTRLITRVREATDEELLRVHRPAYLEELRGLEGSSLHLDPDTWLGPGTLRAARLAAGAAIEAVASVCSGAVANAFSLCRPPGHHAEPDRAMGFCLFNNVAVAAAWARDVLGLSRILIVDWDVHHGNGTQTAFYDRGEVLFFSTHRAPFYPSTGHLEEVGIGSGVGMTVNAPLPPRLNDADYVALFEEVLVPIADAFRPQLVLVSAGFDPHEDDPLGGMGLRPNGFAHLTSIVKELARRHADGRLVLLLEGGYDLGGLVDSVLACTRTLAGEPPASLIEGPTPRGLEALATIRAFHRRHWPVLRG